MEKAKKVNKLNDLTGNEWLFWTNTVYLTNYPPDATHELRKRHGAMKPPQVMAEIIRFFTKKEQFVLDPFAGVGGTLLGAALCRRKAMGFEINEEWVRIYRYIQENYVVVDGQFVKKSRTPSARETLIDADMVAGDCLKLCRKFPPESIDAVITDPPYGCHHGSTGFRDETNFNMQNSMTDDLGNSSDFLNYLDRMEEIGEEVRRILRPQKYFVLIMGDRYFNGEYVPLGLETAQRMKRIGFKLKGIKIWSNRATVRPLKPYGIYNCFVPNITHQNIVILQK